MSELKTREQIDARYKWDLGDIFASDEAWEKAFNTVKERSGELAAFKGKLGDEEKLYEFLTAEHEISILAERLYVYARMSRDQDNGCDTYVSMCDRAQTLLMNMEEQTAYVTPELSALDDQVLKGLSENPKFADHSRFFESIIRNKAHLLSEGEERILALSQEVGGSFDNIFTMLSDVDMTFEPIIAPDGERIELSHGRYGLLLQDKNRDVRRQAYVSMYDAHIKNINTLTALYSSSVKKDVFYSRARHFDSVLQGDLYSGNIPESVYSGLIEAVHSFFPAMHRYIGLRGKLLKVDDLKMYDLYVPTVEVPEVKYSFEDAKKLACESLAPLGEEYVELLERSFKENWIDVFETKGKTSGAYSWGAYGIHPYMLLNYQDRLDDVFTLVHEEGHSMHSYFSDKNLCYEKAQYRIFVAEVASTVNEVLLLKYLLKTNKNEDMQAYLLNHLLDQFRTTVFRQTMFAEFEREAHTLAEQGEALTVKVLNGIYGRLNKEYYGESVETDKYIETEWSRIPHFYRAYYVYQYATGFCSAVKIADMILSEGKPAVERYLKFLASGGSDYPVELLKITGVDLTKPDAIISSLKVFEDTLDEFERMVK